MQYILSLFSCGCSTSQTIIEPIVPPKSSINDLKNDNKSLSTNITLSNNAQRKKDRVICGRKIQTIQKKQLQQRKIQEKIFIKNQYTKENQLQYIVEQCWGQQYTKYLNNPNQTILRSFNNTELIDCNGNLKQELKQYQHYYIINESVWTLISILYGGGPMITKEQPNKLQKDKSVKICGFKNESNLSSMISVIQCLLSISELLNYCSKVSNYIQISQNTINKKYHNFIHKIIKQYNKINLQQSDCSIDYSFLMLYPNTHLNKQPDLYQYLIDLLINLEKQSEIVMKYLFNGQQKQSVSCRICGSQEIKFNSFQIVQVEITHRMLQNCLTNYFHRTIQNLQYYCSNCKISTDTNKRITTTKFPKQLIINLKKITNQNQSIDKRIKYPLKLMLKNFCNINVQFYLRSVIIHKKTDLNQGYNFCLTRRNQKWFYCNDQVYQSINVNQVLHRNAYFLFYERID